MAISMGNTGRAEVSDINVTPMIDVLLVLLVIFIIAQPLLQKALDVQIPKEEQKVSDPAPQIVLEIAADGSMAINQQAVASGGLGQRLHEIYDARPDKVLFVKADPEVMYQDVITALDVARGAGVSVLGAVF